MYSIGGGWEEEKEKGRKEEKKERRMFPIITHFSLRKPKVVPACRPSPPSTGSLGPAYHFSEQPALGEGARDGDRSGDPPPRPDAAPACLGEHSCSRISQKMTFTHIIQLEQTDLNLTLLAYVRIWFTFCFCFECHVSSPLLRKD